MKTGILFDIHGNIEALEASLGVLGDVDKILHGGDLIGWGPEPDKVINLIAKKGISGITGNHELLARNIFTENNPTRNISTRWTRSGLSQKHINILSSLPYYLCQNSFSLYHSIPQDFSSNIRAEHFPYLRKKDDFIPYFDTVSKLSAPLLMVGHVHIPACYSFSGENKIEVVNLPASLDKYEIPFGIPGQKVVVVAGSLGWPRDGGENLFVPVVDDERMVVTFRKVLYNPASLIERMKTIQGYPQSLIDVFLACKS